LSATLVKILKGELKEKGKGIPLSTAAEFLFLFPPLSLSIGVTGKRKRCRLYSTDRKTKKWKRKEKLRISPKACAESSQLFVANQLAASLICHEP